MNQLRPKSDTPDEIVRLCENIALKHYQYLAQVFGSSHEGLNCILNCLIHSMVVLIHRNNPPESTQEMCEMIKECLKYNLEQCYKGDEQNVGV